MSISRRRRTYEPIGVTHIGTLLAEAIGDSARVREALGVWPAWEQAVGPHIARAARPVALRGGTLLIHVKHAVWMQELTQMRETLLRQIRRVAAAGVVKDLRFKIAPLPDAAVAPEAPVALALPRATIPYDVARAIRTVQSPKLRGVMMRVAARWSALLGPEGRGGPR